MVIVIFIIIMVARTLPLLCPPQWPLLRCFVLIVATSRLGCLYLLVFGFKIKSAFRLFIFFFLHFWSMTLWQSQYFLSLLLNLLSSYISSVTLPSYSIHLTSLLLTPPPSLCSLAHSLFHLNLVREKKPVDL